jgi:hypothetical protein
LSIDNAVFTPSLRAQLISRRTYNRPLDDAGTIFETWDQTVDRVIGHQEWLWERAKGSKLDSGESKELETLRSLMLQRKSIQLLLHFCGNRTGCCGLSVAPDAGLWCWL